MKYTWTLIIFIFLGGYEIQLFSQTTQSTSAYFENIAKEEITSARQDCAEGNVEAAKTTYESALKNLRKSKSELQMQKQKKSTIKKIDKLIAAVEKELNECLSSQKKDYETDVWDQIDITSPPSKIEAKRMFPWWWLVGPVAIVTGTIWILSEEEEDMTPPPPLAANIGIVIDCGEGGQINPTLNDTGRGINITDFDNTSGWVTLQGNTLFISTEANESFTIPYTITDELGRTSSAIVQVTVLQGSPAVPATITLELARGATSQVRVFEFFECPSCTLTGVDENSAFLMLSTNPSGEINFQLDPDFAGSLSISYRVLDMCQREITGTLIIAVEGQPCEIDGSPEVVNSNCGLNDGVIIFTTEEIFGPYNYFLDNEPVSDTIRQLVPGDYELRVEVAENPSCFEVFDLTVDQSSFEVLDEVTTAPGNCYTSGSATLSMLENALQVYQPQPGLVLEIRGPEYDFQTELPGTPNIDLVQIIENEAGILPVLGAIEINVFVAEASDQCRQSLSFVIEEEDVDFQVVQDQYTTGVGIPLTANVLFNDSGTGVTVVGFTPLQVASFDITAEGMLSFRSENAGIFQSTYTVRDTCGREMTGSIRIEVMGNTDCDLTGNLEITPASCGKNDGSAIATVQITGVSDPVWEIPDGWVQEGDFIFVNNSLPAGSVSVVMTETTTGCSLELSSIVEEEAAEYIVNISSTDATCITSGDIIVEIVDIPDSYMICLLDTSQNVIGEWPANPGINSLQQFTDIEAGTYTVQVKIDGFPERCTSSGNITVVESPIPFMVVNDTVTINQGESWSGNVLSNDVGTGLRVIAFTQAPNGVTSVDDEGNATFTPTLSFDGVTTFFYTVEDACGKTGNAMVTIKVIAGDCNFSGQVNVTPASCGISNGSATFNITTWPPACDGGSACDLIFDWSNGASGNSVSNLPSGDYSVTVTIQPIGCSEVFDFTIESSPLDYYASIDVSAGNCLDGGNIVINFNNQSIIAPSLSVTVLWNEEQVFQTVTDWSVFDLSDFINVFPGDYEIILLATGLPEACSETVNLEVPQTDLPLELPDQMYSIPFGQIWSGNVLDNALGTALVISAFTIPAQASLTITLDGDAVLIPNDGFSGSLIFEITATDICGQRATATVTVMVGDIACLLIQTVSIIPGNCNVGTVAIVSLNNPDGIPLDLSLTIPGGEVFMTTTTDGVFDLSSLTTLPGGTYLLEVSDGICTDILSFDLEPIDLPSLDLLEINHPSAPDAFDGSILINLSGGSGPYTVLINGNPQGPFAGGVVNLPNLPQGLYDLVAIDGNDCPSQMVEVLLLPEMLPPPNEHIIISIGNLSGWSPFSANQVSLPEQWLPGLKMPEHSIPPHDILVIQGGSIEAGGTFGRDWKLPIQVFIGQTSGQIFASHPTTSERLSGLWNSTYAGISLAPRWKIGKLEGTLKLGGLIGQLSGHLHAGAVDFDLRVLAQALRLTPSFHIPFGQYIHMEVGYDILININQHYQSTPTLSLLATF